jgi:hypothetical protein
MLVRVSLLPFRPLEAMTLCHLASTHMKADWTPGSNQHSVSERKIYHQLSDQIFWRLADFAYPDLYGS